MTSDSIDDILQRLHKLQHELEQEVDRLLDEKRRQFRYTLRLGKVRFEQGMKVLQRQQRTGLWAYLRKAPLRHLLTAPVTYSLIMPFLLLDLFVTLYQQICFRAYRIPQVKRSDYIIIDRHQLAYLNLIEKLNCVFCGYANGLVAYVREIAARTEQYWCPIKHTRRIPDPHRLEKAFIDYGDLENYRQRVNQLREQIRQQSAE